MKIIENPVSNYQMNYPLGDKYDLSKTLFVDIETTGFTARSSNLYLIGCVYHKPEGWFYKQFFADTPSEEIEILKAYIDFVSAFEVMIHFNGNQFDIPYLEQKCAQYQIDHSFSKMNGIDLYRRIAPYRNFLKVPDCKQKTLERYIGIDRQDRYNGGELIDVYHRYTQSADEELLFLLLLHNADDLRGMLMLLPILAYYDLFNSPIRVLKVQANRYFDENGTPRTELLMKLLLPHPLPSPLTNMSGGCYFRANGDDVILKVPLYEGELKYFYAGYKDYYYLPAEDQAIHKSIASFVDKEHRIPATAATCYTRKTGQFLPEWDMVFTPFFKTDYHAKAKFFELTPERKTDRAFFSEYASHVLAYMGTGSV